MAVTLSNPKKNQARLGLECLETREVLSWSAIPPTVLPSGGDRFTLTRSDRDGVYRDTDRISNNEVDSYKFTAQRSGLYTFEAGRAGSSSRIDTVIALFDSAGKRTSYNDDASSNTTNSKMTVSLVAGRTYTLGITNYRGTSNGLYEIKISPPRITATNSTGLGRVSSSGNATLEGTTLTVTLDGQTMNNFGKTIHSFTVKILDRNGQSIHTGVYADQFRTAGRWELSTSDPARRSRTYPYDVSHLDLFRASKIYIVVHYA